MKTLLTSLALLVTACGASSTAPDAGSSDASADASDGQIAPDAGDAAATDSGADAETPVVSVPMLNIDPSWDPIRKNPAFEALLQKYADLKPAPASTSGGHN